MYEIPWYLFKLISENEKSRKKSDDSGSALEIVAREFAWEGNCVCLIEWECRSDALITRLLSCKKNVCGCRTEPIKTIKPIVGQHEGKLSY